MIWTGLSCLCKLLGLASWAEKLLERNQIKNEGKLEVVNEINEKKNAVLGQAIALGDRVDALPDTDELRDRLNHRP